MEGSTGESFTSSPCNTSMLGVNVKMGCGLSRVASFVFDSADEQHRECTTKRRSLPSPGLGGGGERPGTNLCLNKGCSQEGLLLRPGKKP